MAALEAAASFAAVPGLFVTFEGIDRSGKTTQAALLIDALGDEAVGVREPGGTAAGERVRELLKDPGGGAVGAEAEALLFAAARAELVRQVIRPALAEGRVVVSDRFLDSSLAYQGAARGLGVDEVRRVNAPATGGLVPDLTVLLELDPRRPPRARGRGGPLRGARARSCSARWPTPTRSWPPPSRSGGVRIDADRDRPRRCTPTCWRAVRDARGAVSPGMSLARHRGPPARAVALEAALAGGPSHAYLFHGPGRRGQARGGARVRRRAAGRRAATIPTASAAAWSRACTPT